MIFFEKNEKKRLNVIKFFVFLQAYIKQGRH